MSLVKDFDKLHFGTKGTILNIVSTVPFFFISVYLFSNYRIAQIENNPFADIDFYFILAVCFCVSLLWFLMNFILAIITINFIEWIDSLGSSKKTAEPVSERELSTNNGELEEDDTLKISFITTYIYSIGYLAIAFYINYSWAHISFRWFTLWCFGFIIFRLAIVGFVHRFLKKEHKKAVKEENKAKSLQDE
jgi:hypothetical protein